MAWLQDVDARSKRRFVGPGRRSQSQVPRILGNSGATNARDSVFFGLESPTQIEAMSYLQGCIDQLSSAAAPPTIAVYFLIASILVWYVGGLIQWLRR